jgi:hypothetical protein
VTAERIAADIERELKQVAEDLGFFDRQLPPGRAPIVTDTLAEAEVCFKIRESQDLSDGRPEAYVVLRELRSKSLPNRPSMYWYGLVERLENGDSLYEAFHGHDEIGRPFDTHYQVEIHTGQPRRRIAVERTATHPIHAVSAVRYLMTRYYERLAARIPED